MSHITSNIKKIKHVLVPFTRFRPNLKPANDLQESTKANTGTWTSTGDDPQFLIEFPKRSLIASWYMISFDIDSSNVCDEAKLYINTGAGIDESDAIKIPYQSRKSAKRLVKIPRHAKSLRFDPQSCAGEFQVREFSATPVSFSFAEKRMLTKLMNRLPSEDNYTLESAKSGLQRRARSVGQSYQQVLEQSYSALFSASQRNQSYGEWIAKYEATSFPSAAATDQLNAMPNPVKVAVIMPTYNSDLRLLDAAIQSVVDQSYDHWQLCISDGGSDSEGVVDAINRWVKSDKRITATFQTEATAIAENTNCAIKLADSDYCVFLDHDDLLACHALFEVAKCAADNRDLKLIYSDEDKLNGIGQRLDPHFKPDWNPDLLLSQNYICHLVAIECGVLEKTGGCRAGFEGAQDHDLLLRVMREVSPEQVRHIPKILYHWRMADGSTAAAASAKSYSTDSGVAAVQDYLRSTGEGATAESGKYPNTYRVRWPVTAEAPLVSIIIPTRDRLGILSQCVSSVLERTSYPNYEIIVVDNESAEQETLDYFDEIRRHPDIRVISYRGAFNFSAINNFTVEQAHGSVITMMNNDIEVINNDWLNEMVAHAIRPSVGCVGAKLLYKNNMVQHAGVILGIGGVAGHAHKYFDAESAGYFSRLHLTQNMSAVTAACLTVEKQTYLDAGGLNESDLKVAFNDVDFCLRVGALGLRNVWSPYALLYHHESVSRGHENTSEKKTRFNNEAVYMQQRWGRQLQEDPAYNRNLTLVHEDFSLAA